MDVYRALLVELAQRGVSWVRLDEPALVEDRSADELAAFCRAYQRMAEQPDRPNLAVSTYFGHVGGAMAALSELPIEGVGLDFCRGPENLGLLSEADGLGNKVLFAGVVDGRNVWANDLDASLTLLDRLTASLKRLWCQRLVRSCTSRSIWPPSPRWIRKSFPGWLSPRRSWPSWQCWPGALIAAG